MLITLLYFTGLRSWELLLLLLVYLLFLIVFVGLPLALLVFVIIKFVQYRRDISAVKNFDAEQQSNK